MQLCTGGDLFTYLCNHRDTGGHLGEGEAKYIMYQLIQGLIYLHDRNIAHRGTFYMSRVKYEGAGLKVLLQILR